MSECLDHVIRAHEGKRCGAIQIPHTRNSIPVTNNQTKPKCPTIGLSTNHTPRKFIFTSRQKVFLKRVASFSDLLSRDLYTLYANGICSRLPLGSRPTYHNHGKSLEDTLMLCREGLTLCSIPASARAMYAPREYPSEKRSDCMG